MAFLEATNMRKPYLDAVFETIELALMLAYPMPFSPNCVLRLAKRQPLSMLTSQQELAIWQPAWPTVRVDEVSKQILQVGSTIALRLERVKREHTIQAYDFSHCDNDVRYQLQRGNDILVCRQLLHLFQGNRGSRE